MVNLELESLSTSNIIRPVTPKNVISLPSSLTKTSDNGVRKPTDELNEKCENWELNNLFTVENNGKTLPNGKSFIDHIFENYDDMHAAYKRKNENSPEKVKTQITYSAMTNHTPSPHSYENLETEEAKSKRLLATIEGRKDFCEILEHAGINSSAYLAGVFSSKKKGRKQNFGCSTPIAQTPQSNRITTPLPLSGIRLLISPLKASSNSNGYLTPASEWAIPDHAKLPQTENMGTILLGITCYVEVRTEKENNTESCKQQLLSIGAKIEKNFTKKVTHVIFKEGRMSTYLKAKKNDIPIVSVVWIEACKLAKGPVDPNLYPPTRMEKYENEPTFSEIMKRSLKLLKKGGLFEKGLKGQSLNLTSNVRKSSKRKALTEVKKGRAQEKLINKERHCTKKLNFIDIDEPKSIGDEKNDLMTLDVALNESDNLSDSSTFEKFKLKTLPKRKSAPGALAKKKRGRLKTLNDFYVKKHKDEERERSKTPDENIDPEGNFLSPEQLRTKLLEQNDNNKCKNFITTTESKKRKLFDPSEPHLLSEVYPKSIEISYPYAESPTPVRKKAKTRMFKSRNIDNITSKTESASCSENFQMRFSEVEDNVSAPRNSLSLFVRNPGKVTTGKPKQTPTIVFTSIHRKECEQLSVIVKKLGTFEVEDQVSEKTSHVVTSSLRRTLNLLRGIARGCWIVRVDWIFNSESASQWLAEEHFEVRSFTPAVTECRLQRQAFKKAFHMDLFSSCGTIYVAPNTNPPMHDLIVLIKLCRGKVVPCARGAKIIIGDKAISDRTIVRVKEKWILDSVFYYKLMNMEDYIVFHPSTEKLQNNSSDIQS